MNPDILLSSSVSITTLRAEVIFFERFAQLIASDVPLLRAIEIAAEELSDRELRNVIHAIKLSLEQGESISDAFRRYPDYFSKFAIAIIDSGEREGRLDENVSKLAAALRREVESRKAAESASAPLAGTIPTAAQLDEQTITYFANRFAESFITAIELWLIKNQRKEFISNDIKKELCLKCQKKIELRLKQSGKLRWIKPKKR
jgi:hypothetical protein